MSRDEVDWLRVGRVALMLLGSWMALWNAWDTDKWNMWEQEVNEVCCKLRKRKRHRRSAVVRLKGKLFRKILDKWKKTARVPVSTAYEAAVDYALAYVGRSDGTTKSMDDIRSAVEELNNYERHKGVAPLSLDPKLVSLPPVGHKPVKVERLLPDAVKGMLREETMILPREQWRSTPVCRRVKNGEYVNLVERVLKAGMLSMSDSPPKVEVGLFGVPKEESQRMIDDARAAGAAMIAPPSPDLCGPSIFAVLGSGLKVVAGMDLSNYFHTLRMPDWLCSYFGWPKLTTDECAQLGIDPSTPYPLRTTCPQGWTWSSYLGQMVHREVVMRAVARFTERFPDVVVCVPSSAAEAARAARQSRDKIVIIVALYIDDNNMFGLGNNHDKDTIKCRMNELIDDFRGAYAEAGLLEQAKKCVAPNYNELEALGHVVSVGGVIGVSAQKRQDLVRLTRASLERSTVSAKAVEHLLGKWVWCMLARRSTLSALNEVFQLVSRARSRGWRYIRVTKRLRMEFQLVCNLAPAMVTPLTSEANSVVAFDACLEGYGVTYAPAIAAERDALIESLTVTGCYSNVSTDKMEDSIPDAVRSTNSWFLEGSPDTLPVVRGKRKWRVARHGAWNSLGEHINVYEIKTGLMALEKAISISKSCHSSPKEIFVCGDNTASIGALARGRSSSYTLLRSCRKACVLQLIHNVRVNWIWISTHINPADAPSRWAIHRKAVRTRARTKQKLKRKALAKARSYSELFWSLIPHENSGLTTKELDIAAATQLFYRHIWETQ